MAFAFFKNFKRSELLLLGLFFIFLVAVTWPNFEKFRCRSIQSEAKTLLSTIYLAEKLYHEDFGTYTSFDVLKSTSRLSIPEKRYRFVSQGTPDSHHFEVQAIGKVGSQMERDIWSVNETGNVWNFRNACTQQ